MNGQGFWLVFCTDTTLQYGPGSETHTLGVAIATTRSNIDFCIMFLLDTLNPKRKALASWYVLSQRYVDYIFDWYRGRLTHQYV